MPRMIHFNKSYDNEVASKEEGDDVKETMNKGPWTPQEDVILKEYVSTYGEGMWNSVYKRSGLARCGKSCRLRWVNHLSPYLKKGTFSEEEEQLIIQLHAQLGNKWARMAVQLPGRTDNEIKNFWNTRLKKCLKEGLPIYPPEIVQHQLREQQQFTQPQYSPQLSFSSFISSSCGQELNNLNQSSTANPQQKDPNFFHTNPYPQFNFPKENNGSTGNVSFPSSPVSPYGYPWFNRCFAANESYGYQFGSYNHGLDSSSAIGGSPYESFALVQGLNTEFSSSQSPPGSTTPVSSYVSDIYGLMGASSMANASYEVTPLSPSSTTHVSSYANGVYGLMGASSMASTYYEVEPLSPKENGGMLDSLLMETQSPFPKDKSNNEDSITTGKLSYKRKSIAIEEDDTVHIEPAMKNSAKITNNPQTVDFNSSQFSTGKKPITKSTLEGINSMDDDLFSLFNNFPSGTPVPGCYHNGETQSLGLETQQDASSSAPTDQELDWTLDTFWNNMPNIC